jgi:hypothetical protein
VKGCLSVAMLGWMGGGRALGLDPWFVRIGAEVGRLYELREREGEMVHIDIAIII